MARINPSTVKKVICASAVIAPSRLCAWA